MRDARSRILHTEPYYKYGEKDVTPDEVRSAALGICEVRSLDDLKVLAYARYTGALETEALSDRLTGNARLSDLIRGLLSTLNPIDQELMLKSVGGHYSGYSGIFRGRTGAEGWTVALLTLIHECDPDRLRELLDANDPGFLLLRWALNAVWDSAGIEIAVRAWAVRNDALYLAAAALLVWRSAESTINTGSGLVPLADIDHVPRIVICRSIIARLAAWRIHAQWSEERSKRLSVVLETLSQFVAEDMQARPDVKRFAEGDRDGDDLHLIPFLLSLSLEPKVRNHVRGSAEETLKRVFGRVADIDPMTSSAYPHVAQWMLNPLASMAISLPMSAPLFESLIHELRWDEFAYAFAHSHYLVDRPRALVLCAIGAIVATVQNDSDLHAAVEQLSSALGSLPPTHSVLTPEVLEQLRDRFGLSIADG